MGLDLVTLAEYKTYANILGTSQDAAISAMIPRISNLVKQICRRTFVDYVDDAKVDVFRGGYVKLYLPESPLIVLQSLEFSSDFGATYTTLTEFTDYVVDVSDSAVEFITEPYSSYSRVNAFRATYNAGYEVLPPDLKLAVMDALMHQIRNDGAIHSTGSIGSNTTQLEYLANAQLPAHIRRVLQLYSDNYS
jgi:hypothetical protein